MIFCEIKIQNWKQNWNEKNPERKPGILFMYHIWISRYIIQIRIINIIKFDIIINIGFYIAIINIT